MEKGLKPKAFFCLFSFLSKSHAHARAQCPVKILFYARQVIFSVLLVIAYKVAHLSAGSGPDSLIYN